MTDFSTEMTQKLKAGGEEGIKIFLGMARISRTNSGNQGSSSGFKPDFRRFHRKTNRSCWRSCLIIPGA